MKRRPMVIVIEENVKKKFRSKENNLVLLAHLPAPGIQV